jgi:glutathione S-transferase
MLTLYAHPLSSFSWKALIALYENATPFEPVILDQHTFAEFVALWPIGKFPVLHDGDRDELVPEASLIIEYLDRHYPGPTRFLPDDPESAHRVRLWDRVFDNYVQAPMQKIVTDRVRPEGKGDPHGVEEAKRRLSAAYGVIETQLGDRPFITGDRFTMADCAAAPALYYATRNAPLTAAHPRLAAYVERLKQRPSFARALEEAQPYFHLYPGD